MNTVAISTSGQQLSIFVPDDAYAKLAIDGAFVGNLAFTLNQGTGANPVNLINPAGSASSASAPGEWIFAPGPGGGGLLVITSTNWVSGNALLSLSTLQDSDENTEIQVLPSATRTATINSPTLKNPFGRGIVIFLNITQASGTGGLRVNLLNVDPVSGNAISFLGPEAAVTGTVLIAYTYYPGFTSGAGGGNSGVVTRSFQIQVIHGDSSNYTYSVGCCLVR